MSDELEQWLESAPAEVKQAFGGSINVINFMHEQRNICFQMPGMHDGSISTECSDRFRAAYKVFDAFIEAMRDWQ